MSLGLWLRAGRAERGLSLDDVARKTKIQPRILERIEAGSITGEGLPAEVFVRGFIRSYAKCCGLDEAEALSRYAAATLETRPIPVPPAARAMVDVMSDLAPRVAKATQPPPEPVADEPSPSPSPNPSPKKKKRNGKRARRASKRLASGTPSEPTPVVTTPVEVAESAPIEEPALLEEPTVVATPVAIATPVDHELQPVDQLDPLVEPPDANEDIVATETWQPKMPPIATTTSSVPWRRPASFATSTAASVPTLVIDDNDPESAAQVLEDREAAKSVLTNAQRRSFLPPILLDREDRTGRQGGLTLAVIILLIAATLTLSYLMRRPSSSGDGVTSIDTETQLVG